MMSLKIDRTGEALKNNNGRLMKICSYNNSNDIDVCFEDGTIVKHKHYSAFKKGSIQHPGDKISVKDYIGQTKQQKNGQVAKIISAQNYANITVMFENGTTNKTSMGNFLKGLVGTGENRYTEEEDKLILELFNKDRKKLLSLFPNRSKVALKSRYYSLNPDVKQLPKHGKLSEDYPLLWEEVLDKEENTMTTAGSNKPILWKYKCGHIGYAKPVQRIHGMGCPYCSGERILKGVNDFQTLFPDIAAEWDQEKNNILPSEVFPMSNKKYWWKCSTCGYEWKANVNNRTSKHKGCPKCSAKRVGDMLRSTTKDFVENAHKIHGYKYDYSYVNYHSCHEKVLILCKEHGYFWQTPIEHLKGAGCPHCASSHGESIIFNYLKNADISFEAQKTIYYSDGTWGFIDYFTNKGAIEFDGRQHFQSIDYFGGRNGLKSNLERDKKKNDYCKKEGIPLLRIRYDQIDEIEKILDNFISNPTFYIDRYNPYLTNEEYYSIKEATNV